MLNLGYGPPAGTPLGDDVLHRALTLYAPTSLAHNLDKLAMIAWASYLVAPLAQQPTRTSSDYSRQMAAPGL